MFRRSDNKSISKINKIFLFLIFISVLKKFKKITPKRFDFFAYSTYLFTKCY